MLPLPGWFSLPALFYNPDSPLFHYPYSSLACCPCFSLFYYPCPACSLIPKPPCSILPLAAQFYYSYPPGSITPSCCALCLIALLVFSTHLDFVSLPKTSPCNSTPTCSASSPVSSLSSRTAFRLLSTPPPPPSHLCSPSSPHPPPPSPPLAIHQSRAI